MKYQDIPILVLGYNRPEHIKKLILSLRKVRPKIIYISLDGPKNNLTDKKKNESVKKEIEKIDWKCKIKKKYNTTNLGCRESVSTGISWFFRKNRFGIILEDDCIPNKSFFIFCQKIDAKYSNNQKVFAISGSNFFNRTIKNDFFFSKYNHCWGWATWSRAWKYYDNKLTFWSKWKYSKQWKHFHDNMLEKKYWEKIFDNVLKRKIDSWAYVWTCCVWRKNGLTIIPKKNLIENIGFDMNATNTIDNKKIYKKASELKLKKNLNFKISISPLKENDAFVFENHFKGKYSLWPWMIIKLLKMFAKNPLIFFIKLNNFVRK